MGATTGQFRIKPVREFYEWPEAFYEPRDLAGPGNRELGEVYYPDLKQIDIQSLVKACDDKWYNQTLCEVNESVVRLGIVQGEYHWHKHEREDEFFFTLEGMLIVDVEDGESVELHPHQGYVVPKGVVHRTRAPDKTVILMVESKGIIPTGDTT